MNMRNLLESAPDMTSLSSVKPANRWHYAWVVVVVTFLTLLFAAAVRSIPSVVMKSLETDFGWNKSTISFSVAISLIFYGLGGPLAGKMIARFGPRKVMFFGLGLTAVGLVLLMNIQELWHFYIAWGVLIGIGTGSIANVLSATVADRWFNRHRGMVLGILGAAVAVGQLIFLPNMMLITTDIGWRSMIGLMAAGVGLTVLPILVLMRDKPEDMGLEPYGGKPTTAAAANADKRTTSMREALRTRDFWLLAGSFFICGYTTNGLIGTHLLTHAVEHGFVEVQAASAVALMGAMNIVGTLASGWLTDRYDNRKLLGVYYGMRALSLMALPFILQMEHLMIFSVIYGLDWVATVPPTVNLTAQRFGRQSMGTIFGWIFFSHMVGAAVAAQAGGFFRDLLGDYHLIFISAALMGIIASTLSMSITRQRNNIEPTLAEAQ